MSRCHCALTFLLQEGSQLWGTDQLHCTSVHPWKRSSGATSASHPFVLKGSRGPFPNEFWAPAVANSSPWALPLVVCSSTRREEVGRGQGCWAPAGVSLRSLYRCNPHSQPSLGRPRHTPDGTTHRSPRRTAPSPPAREHISNTQPVMGKDTQAQFLARKHLLLNLPEPPRIEKLWGKN